MPGPASPSFLSTLVSPLVARIAAPIAALKAGAARLPSQCELCRQWRAGSSTPTRRTDGALCSACIARFAAARPRCARCALPTGLAMPACGDCLRDPPPFRATVCAIDYTFPWQQLISNFKFHGNAELAGLLAARLVQALHDSSDNTDNGHGALPQLVLPVPLAPARLAGRGYNQAWELARRCAAAFGLRADATLLQRHVDTAHQTTLDRAARQRNLRSAFMVDARRRATLQGLHVALVDDVMTTGATVREASAVLLRGGAARVDIWVLARTPNH